MHCCLLVKSGPLGQLRSKTADRLTGQRSGGGNTVRSVWTQHTISSVNVLIATVRYVYLNHGTNYRLKANTCSIGYSCCLWSDGEIPNILTTRHDSRARQDTTGTHGWSFLYSWWATKFATKYTAASPSLSSATPTVWLATTIFNGFSSFPTSKCTR